MNAVVPLHNPTTYTGQQMALIRRTVAADCNPAEFDLFMAAAMRAGLDPFRKQIGALVFNKDKPDKRRMAIVTYIDGLRAIADRSGVYRPDEDEPQYTFDPEVKSETNPLGLVKAVVRIFKNDRPVTGVAYWDEFAPVTDEWAYDQAQGKRAPTGKQKIDGQWGKMGRIMLAKCAEAQALRKAFPEDLSGLYERSELDQASASDLTPSEIIEATAVEDRMTRIGAGGGIMIQLFPNSPLESIPFGQFADRVVETVDNFSSPEQLRWFESANRHPLQEFWARSPGDALEVKKRIEAARAKLEAAGQ